MLLQEARRNEGGGFLFLGENDEKRLGLHHGELLKLKVLPKPWVSPWFGGETHVWLSMSHMTSED